MSHSGADMPTVRSNILHAIHTSPTGKRHSSTPVTAVQPTLRPQGYSVPWISSVPRKVKNSPRKPNALVTVGGTCKKMLSQAASWSWPAGLAKWFVGERTNPVRKNDSGVRPTVAMETRKNTRVAFRPTVLHGSSGGTPAFQQERFLTWI